MPLRNYISNRDSNRSSEIGSIASSKFLKSAEKHGWCVVESSVSEDRMKHIDCFISKDGLTYSVDVKSIKRRSRHGEFSEDLLWVELVGITGHRGWIFGEADLIAFQRSYGFDLVPRMKIVEFIGTLNLANRAKRPEESLYKRYTRMGRKDVLVTIKMSDIEQHVKLVFLDE